ncbi:MAG: DinB family protein [Rectinemataceae bacterium]
MKKKLLVALDNNKKLLKQFVKSMTDQEISRRIRDYWTIYEHIDHLVITQKMLLGRIEQFMREDNPVMRPYTPEDKPNVDDPQRTAMELVAEFRDLRDKQIKLIRKAKDSVWRKTGTHEEYVKYSFEILVRHIILHDSFHMHRMEELWIEKEEHIKELK